MFRVLPLIVACACLAACATPENRRELTGPYYPYKPMPYVHPEKDVPYTASKETTVWYGPDTRKQITGRWGLAGHRPDLNYPNTPQGIKQRVISRNNWKGLRAQQIADRNVAVN